MRLHEVEKGDGFGNRLLIRVISGMSGMRLPDAARIVMYHSDFYGKPMTAWTHAAMRGESSWTVGERELIAAVVAQWCDCPFCINAHGSIASLALSATLVKSVLQDFRQADISSGLQATLAFLERLVKTPDSIVVDDIRPLIDNGITQEALEDAIGVAVLFSITVRCANAFKFELMNDNDSVRGARRMLKQGYVFGNSKLHGHPVHQAMAEVLEKRVFQGPGITTVVLRQAIADRTIGGSPIEAPYDQLALQIGEGAYRITDELIKSVVIKAGSEKAAFELITSASVSAGLYRWRKGLEFPIQGFLT